MELLQVLGEELRDMLALADEFGHVCSHAFDAVIAGWAPEQQPLGLKDLECVKGAPGHFAAGLDIIAPSVLHATTVRRTAKHDVVNADVPEDVVEGFDDVRRTLQPSQTTNCFGSGSGGMVVNDAHSGRSRSNRRAPRFGRSSWRRRSRTLAASDVRRLVILEPRGESHRLESRRCLLLRFELALDVMRSARLGFTGPDCKLEFVWGGVCLVPGKNKGSWIMARDHVQQSEGTSSTGRRRTRLEVSTPPLAQAATPGLAADALTSLAESGLRQASLTGVHRSVMRYLAGTYGNQAIKRVLASPAPAAALQRPTNAGPASTFLIQRMRITVNGRATTTAQLTANELAFVLANQASFTNSEYAAAVKEDQARQSGVSNVPVNKGAPKTQTSALTLALTEARTKLKSQLDSWANEAGNIINDLNDATKIELNTFDAGITLLLNLKNGMFKKVTDAGKQLSLDESEVREIAKQESNAVNMAATIAKGYLNKANGDIAILRQLIKDGPIKWSSSNFKMPTMDFQVGTPFTQQHGARPGIRALLTVGVSQTTLNAILNKIKAFLLAPKVEPHLALLDTYAQDWQFVKPGTITRFFDTMSKGGTWTIFKGSFSELAELHRVVSSGALAQGTKLSLGKDKDRPITAAMKADTKPTQDVDITFTGAEGYRHYHEVKADPDTLVDKIGGQPAEAYQAISYAETKRTRELKYGQGKSKSKAKGVRVVWITPSRKNWTVIFEGGAVDRLIENRFELIVSNVHFDAVGLDQVRTLVRGEAVSHATDTADVKLTWQADLFTRIGQYATAADSIPR